MSCHLPDHASRRGQVLLAIRRQKMAARKGKTKRAKKPAGKAGKVAKKKGAKRAGKRSAKRKPKVEVPAV
jgi:hypothetical protein